MPVRKVRRGRSLSAEKKTACRRTESPSLGRGEGSINGRKTERKKRNWIRGGGKHRGLQIMNKGKARERG